MGTHFRPSIFNHHCRLHNDSARYRFIMQNYRLVLFSHSISGKTHQALYLSPDDKICLFGFSRGGKQPLHFKYASGPSWVTYLLLSFLQPILLALWWGCYTRCDAYLRVSDAFDLLFTRLLSIGWTPVAWQHSTSRFRILCVPNDRDGREYPGSRVQSNFRVRPL